MKIVLQRVSEASVTVDGEVVGQIGKGFLVLLGVQATDTEETADRMVDKMCRLRIFEDENGKTNLSLADEMCIRDRERCSWLLWIKFDR